MIDIHSHVLFEIDDGAEDLKTSFQLCLDSYRNGCDDLVLTPHFFEYDCVSDFVEERNEKLEILRKVLAEKKIPVLLIAGNHDSGSRLAFADKLLCNQGIYIAGEVSRDVKCITLEDQFGPVNFWLVPYLFPAAVNVILNRDDLKDYDSAMRVLLEKQRICKDERNVILSHQFVISGGDKPAMGGSETTVGGIGQIDASAFDMFDYVALGHIHNAQRMGREQVRYAGSPLSYHFSEAGQKKGLTVVDLGEKGNVTITLEELPVLHEMCEVSGTIDDILQMDIKENCYVRAVIRQEILPVTAQHQQSQGFFLPADLHGTENLVLGFVHVVHHQMVGTGRHTGLDRFHQFAEKLVGGALHQYQNIIGTLLLELLGIGIKLKSAGIRRLHNGFASLFAHIGLVIQHPGYGADRIAGFCCEILDGHNWHPFPRKITAFSGKNMVWKRFQICPS